MPRQHPGRAIGQRVQQFVAAEAAAAAGGQEDADDVAHGQPTWQPAPVGSPAGGEASPADSIRPTGRQRRSSPPSSPPGWRRRFPAACGCRWEDRRGREGGRFPLPRGRSIAAAVPGAWRCWRGNPGRRRKAGDLEASGCVVELGVVGQRNHGAVGVEGEFDDRVVRHAGDQGGAGDVPFRGVFPPAVADQHLVAKGLGHGAGSGKSGRRR